MSELLYFAYGSNLDADQMRERCPGAEPRFRARLHDHRLDFTHYSRRWSGGAADVRPHASGIVWGVVYALSADHLPALDAFEGGYRRVQLEVEDDGSLHHRVTSYTVREKRLFRPSDAYLEKLLRWGRRWEFPESYLALLRLARELPRNAELARPTPPRPQPR